MRCSSGPNYIQAFVNSFSFLLANTISEISYYFSFKAAKYLLPPILLFPLDHSNTICVLLEDSKCQTFDSIPSFHCLSI